MTTFQLSNQFASKAIIHTEYQPEASVFESPHGTYFKSAHGTYIDYPNDPELVVTNPLDQMGFTNPSNDVVTNYLQTSWQGSVDKMPWDLFRPAEGNAKETGELLGHPVITDASGAFVSTSQETLVTSWKGSWDKFSIFNDDVGVTATQLQETLVPWTCPDYSNWDVICDIGTSIKQTSVADALTNGGTEGYTEVEWTYFAENEGGTATQLQENCANGTFVKGGQLGYTEVEWTYIGDNLSGTAGPGGSTFTTGYDETVGLDSSTLGPPVLHRINNASDDAGGIAISES